MNQKEQEAANAVLEIIKRAAPENVIAGCHAYNNLMQGVRHRTAALRGETRTGYEIRPEAQASGSDF